MAVDWYHPRTCLQGSWRQAYGLQEICETAANETALSQKLVACQKLAELEMPLEPLDAVVLNPRIISKHGAKVVAEDRYSSAGAAFDSYDARVEDATSKLAAVLREDASYELVVVPESACELCMSPERRYIDAMYWSVTTMTTIGYGDRGPKMTWSSCSL